MRSLLMNLRGVLSAAGVLLNTIVLCTLLYIVALLKLVARRGRLRDGVSRMLAAIGENWITVNSLIMRAVGVRLELDLPPTLNRGGCYLLNCNHQSWVDIPVLQMAFNRRAPFMRFLLKRELIWVPFLGLAWWAMDFPFMRRYSRQQLSKNPGLRGKDLESARKACERFRDIPVSMMNFLEGTRFTPAKHEAQDSPYDHLLKPRVGGLGQVMFSLGDKLESMIDVTIVYPGGRPTFWDLLCGRVQRVVVQAREVAIPDHLRGREFRSDRGFRRELEAWANDLWREKDRAIGELLEPPAA